MNFFLYFLLYNKIKKLTLPSGIYNLDRRFSRLTKINLMCFFFY